MIERVHVEPDGHEYRLDGVKVLSVSEILKYAGLVDYSHIPAKNLERAAHRGTAIHLACEDLDRGRPDWWSDDPELAPRVKAWADFKQHYGFKFSSDCIEYKFFNETYGYAGTIDRFGLVGSRESVVEIKSSTKVYPWTAIQLMAYACGINKGFSWRVAVQLLPTGQYKLHVFDDTQGDTNAWTGAMYIAKWKQENGLC